MGTGGMRTGGMETGGIGTDGMGYWFGGMGIGGMESGHTPQHSYLAHHHHVRCQLLGFLNQKRHNLSMCVVCGQHENIGT